MKKRAVWIIDYNYRVPAYLSVRSFLAFHDLPVTILYCGGKAEAEVGAAFRQLNPQVTFTAYHPTETVPDNSARSTILNRLARMDLMIEAKEELLFLFDGDVFFTKHSKNWIADLELEKITDQPKIWGVVDDVVSASRVLYFRVRDEAQRDIKLSSLEQADILEEVFGEAWGSAARGNVFNNGVLAFYNCQKLGQQWKTYYLKGLTQKYINPADDQLPLAIAMQVVSCEQQMLKPQYNSMGAINGEFAIFHAFSRIWEMQLWSALSEGPLTSDLGELLHTHAAQLPLGWKENFLANFSGKQPFCYHSFSGDFRFKHLYIDILEGLEKGHGVEVGTYQGKSTCFMAELIKYTGKDIQWDSIDDTSNPLYDETQVTDALAAFQLLDQVNLFSWSTEEAVEKYADQSLDFVFLNKPPNYQHLSADLAFWYPKLRPGGILAGYDYGSQDGLDFGYECASYQFCEKHQLSLQIDFDIFLIPIPDQESLKAKENTIVQQMTQA